jgi:hypothetical protein
LSKNLEAHMSGAGKNRVGVTPKAFMRNPPDTEILRRARKDKTSHKMSYPLGKKIRFSTCAAKVSAPGVGLRKNSRDPLFY